MEPDELLPAFAARLETFIMPSASFRVKKTDRLELSLDLWDNFPSDDRHP